MGVSPYDDVRTPFQQSSGPFLLPDGWLGDVFGTPVRQGYDDVCSGLLCPADGLPDGAALHFIP